MIVFSCPIRKYCTLRTRKTDECTCLLIVVPLVAFLDLNRAVHYYYFYIYIECCQGSCLCSKKELCKLVWLYQETVLTRMT